ncbi:type I 3-dehydroquinate dehydratase, partial [Acidobacteria bacterium AH-259-G07]|nr:type I 3-dehydroquinate dehydratase [Acidobacteria bacterium AH-259-G07]
MIDLCLTLAERSPTRLERKIAQYNGAVHYIEVRLDYLGELTVPSVPSGSETEFIATCRPAREGGRYQGEERDRLELLQKAAHSGF